MPISAPVGKVTASGTGAAAQWTEADASDPGVRRSAIERAG